MSSTYLLGERVCVWEIAFKSPQSVHPKWIEQSFTKNCTLHGRSAMLNRKLSACIIHNSHKKHPLRFVFLRVRCSELLLHPITSTAVPSTKCIKFFGEIAILFSMLLLPNIYCKTFNWSIIFWRDAF